MLESNMDRFNDNAFRYMHRVIKLVDKPRKTCDCGCAAKIVLKEQLRCWECAEDEGVKRIAEKRLWFITT